MGEAFSIGFIAEQDKAEQFSNRATLREFHGKIVGDRTKAGIEAYERSLDGIDEAILYSRILLIMAEAKPMIPKFVSALGKRIKSGKVNKLERLGVDRRRIKTLADILRVIQAEFIALRDFTNRNIAVVRGLQSHFDDGTFVATFMRRQTEFNKSHAKLGFGRDTVEVLVAHACGATILASEDIFPLGYEFLLKPKTGKR